LSPTKDVPADLESKTRAELDEIAVDLDVDPDEFSTKAELIAAIEEADTGDADDTDADDDDDESEGPVQPGDESDGKGNQIQETTGLSYSSGTDVDIADLPDTKYKGEHPPLILAGYWVRLGDDADVPERYRGHIAAVVESPWTSSPYADDDQTSAVKGYRYNKDKKFLVRTRDEGNALLEVSLDAFAETGESRSQVLSHG